MKSKYFEIHELMPKKLFEEVKEEVLWRMVPEQLIDNIDRLKEMFNEGSMTINDYYWDGQREWSGLRTKDSKLYSEGSMHSVMGATDSVWSDYSVDEIRMYIMNHQDKFPGIRRIEGEVNWLHQDIKETGRRRIYVFHK